MGGNNPLVVWNARDIHAAAAIAVQSAYLSAGQRCTAARRLIVEDGQHEELIDDDRQADRPADRRSSPRQPGAVHGPGDRQCAADQLQEAFLDLMGKGGRAIRRLDRKADDRPFLTPALIDVTDVARRPDAEMFGPVLQVIRVPDFDAASPRPTPPATASPPS